MATNDDFPLSFFRPGGGRRSNLFGISSQVVVVVVMVVVIVPVRMQSRPWGMDELAGGANPTPPS
jgi:hypothetical protein